MAEQTAALLGPRLKIPGYATNISKSVTGLLSKQTSKHFRTQRSIMAPPPPPLLGPRERPEGGEGTFFLAPFDKETTRGNYLRQFRQV